ncbi:MAG: chromosome segregation protein SMC [Oligoflexia bacterium]
MQIKRLEIQGFKSFKDKTVIHFDEGITGIVGPNGCGKSNIVDAFFWVMGEQSYKHMRGSGSEDLIFNGSSRYAPLDIAEATLVMDTGIDSPTSGPNAPAGASSKDIPVHLRSREVSVTRRVHRSGEGEYFINGVPARLKDIQELFMDTGVGAKGYSVIEQGQIGKIVNAKPEERRLLIEEAAGIAKYKARKKESLRKMEATQGNLSRLNDVVQEIERNLGSLERQATKARRYEEYRTELTDKEMTWGRRKALVLRQKIGSLATRKNETDTELLSLRTELQTVENSIEADRAAQLSDSKAVEELQTILQNAQRELTREQSALDLSRRRQGDLAQQLENLDREKRELINTVEMDRVHLAAQSQELAEGDSTFAQAQQRAKEQDALVREKRQSVDSARRALDQAQRELLQGVEKSNSLGARRASLESRIHWLEEQSATIESEINDAETKASELVSQLTASRENFASLHAQREELRSGRNTQVQEIRDLESHLRESEKARDQGLRQLTQLRSKLQSLEELAQSHEGFGDGPKSILEWASARQPGSIAALADLIDVDSGFEMALESWLEGHLESLLSRDPRLALEALGEIQAQDQGRACIRLAFNKETTDPHTADIESLLSTAGLRFLGSLTSHLRAASGADPELASTALAACHGVAVIEASHGLDDFLKSGGATRLQHLGWSLVSLDGISLDISQSAGAALRGGSLNSDKASSVLGRKKAIAELAVQVEAADVSHTTLSRQADSTRSQLDSQREALAVLEAELRQLEIDCGSLEREIRQTERASQEQSGQVDRLRSTKAKNTEDLAQVRSDLDTASSQLASILSSRADLEGTLKKQESEFAQLESELRDIEGVLQSLKIEEAAIAERASSLKREFQSLQGVLAGRERRIEEITRLLDRATSERNEHTGGDFRCEARIHELTLQTSEVGSRLSETRNQLSITTRRVNEGLERIKQLHKQGDSRNQQSHELALELEKANSDLSHLVQNLEEKYGVGCLENPTASQPIQEEMREPVVTVEMTAEEETALNEQVEQLREKIRRLGEVNPMAVQEFQELQKRYEHLCSEKRDLEHSMQNLQEAIEHINKTSEDRFRKAFEAIADRFEKLFPIIFGGGQAKLSLVYPEGSSDILDAGVDILAQPPGKKIVNMQALSGGEKALTAVSMIFAIFMVKPSPFCLLDEVDAPLDDANVGKFNALLREMSAKSQFIIITHNKKTMELNDTLYGVTMEEPGVSKMVSVRMN